MERCVITIDKQGSVSFSCKNVWMNEMELVELFDVIAPDTPRRYLRRVQERSVEALRDGKVHQVAQRLLFGNVYHADGRRTRFPYQYTNATSVHNTLLERLYLRKERQVLWAALGGGQRYGC